MKILRKSAVHAFVFFTVDFTKLDSDIDVLNLQINRTGLSHGQSDQLLGAAYF